MTEYRAIYSVEGGRRLFETSREQLKLIDIAMANGVLGLDVSTKTCGFFFAKPCVADVDRPDAADWVATTIHLAGETFEARFNRLVGLLPRLVMLTQPEVVAIERTWVGENKRTAVQLTQVYGLVAGRFAEAGARVIGVTPVEGKLAMTGHQRPTADAMARTMALRLLASPNGDFDEHQACAMGVWLHAVKHVLWVERVVEKAGA